jgi:alkyl hydroperoxide reductase subunit AhpF
MDINQFTFLLTTKYGGQIFFTMFILNWVRIVLTRYSTQAPATTNSNYNQIVDLIDLAKSENWTKEQLEVAITAVNRLKRESNLKGQKKVVGFDATNQTFLLI